MIRHNTFLWMVLFGLSVHHAFPQQFFNVKEYGASGQKEELATQAIQKAVDNCHAQGGGTVYLPAGDYLSGTLVLKSQVTLHLGEGATLYASQDTADYQVPFNIYKHNNPHQPVLIYAEAAQHLSIEGKGVIHGQARRTYENLRSVDRFVAKETENARESGVEMKMYYKVPPFVSLIYLVSCQDVEISGVSIRESSDWTLHIQWCERVHIHHCHIQSSLEAGVNADGIDVDGCRDVTISDCIIETGDDAIVLKSTLTHNHYENCENITVTNCVLTSTSSALKIGTETYGDFRHILFNNCAIKNTNRGVGIIVRDGGIVSDVIVSHITMALNRKHFNWWGHADPFWLVVLKRNEDSKLGHIRNVLFTNILAHGQGTARIEGYEGQKLQNISLYQVQLFMHAEDTPDKRTTHALLAKGVENLTLNQVHINWDEAPTEEQWQHALVAEDVNILTIDGFRGRQGLKASKDAVIRLHNVQHAVVQKVEPLAKTETLIQVSGKHTRAIHFSDNDVHGMARQKIVKKQ